MGLRDLFVKSADKIRRKNGIKVETIYGYNDGKGATDWYDERGSFEFRTSDTTAEAPPTNVPNHTNPT